MANCNTCARDLVICVRYVACVCAFVEISFLTSRAYKSRTYAG